MFTGLIEAVGTMERMEPRGKGARLTITRPDAWDPPLEDGESIAVQGACLTVTAGTDMRFHCDVLAETLQRTNLHAKRPGTWLNLERALRMGDRLGGHMVSGHVDGVGTLRDIRMEGDDRILLLRGMPSLVDGIVEKGSVSLDGVSLTVTAVSTDGFAVKIIPWTWEHTSLRERKPGDSLNVETDMLGKYVKRYLAQMPLSGCGVTEEMLRNNGYA